MNTGKSFQQLPVRLPSNYFETVYTSQILASPIGTIFLIGKSGPGGSILRSTDGGHKFSEVFHLPYDGVLGMMTLENQALWSKSVQIDREDAEVNEFHGAYVKDRDFSAQLGAPVSFHQRALRLETPHEGDP
jgi:hypothetical protein